jgi:hypothetical protein
MNWLLVFFLQHLTCHLPVVFVLNFAVLILLFVCFFLQWPQLVNFSLLCYPWPPLILDLFHLFAENQRYHRHFSIKGILHPSHVCFIRGTLPTGTLIVCIPNLFRQNTT